MEIASVVAANNYLMLSILDNGESVIITKSKEEQENLHDLLTLYEIELLGDDSFDGETVYLMTGDGVLPGSKEEFEDILAEEKFQKIDVEELRSRLAALIVSEGENIL